MALLDNSYARLPVHFFARVEPQTVPNPQLLAWNGDLARDLGLQTLTGDDARLARIFSGNELPEGAQPIALAYAGHQFAHFVPQLGDGRAVLLGEAKDRAGQRFDIQLKGSGRTPFSRGGDGKSWLGPVIREYLVSEAMHHLGVPTTRALAAVSTGETVFREQPQPGGVFTRVAASHIRVGTFQYFAARSDADAVRALADFAIDRHYPEAATSATPYRAFFRHVVQAQAALVAKWLSVGFIHGVMNTDNTAVSGETIDYGPCAFMDEFNSAKVFSSIDARGRYAYGRQPAIASWNLARLAECLLMIDAQQADYDQALADFGPQFETHYLRLMRAKLGITGEQADDASLIAQFLTHLQEESLDFTMSFRQLAERVDANDNARFGQFEDAWRARLASQTTTATQVREQMDAINPLFIARNHQVERAIVGAVNDDLSVFNDLRLVLKTPFVKQPNYSHYAQPPAPEERVTQTFCGT